MTIKVITHDRVAHADDAMAAAMLRIAFGGERDIEVVRTRNQAILRAEAGKPGVFLLDIGGKYDPAKRLFDHHQPEGAGYRNMTQKEWPYATAGLIWLHYGAQVVRSLHPGLSDADLTEVLSHIDESLVRHIDAVDCGVWLKHSGPSLSALLASFNPSWFEDERDPFPLMMELSQVILCNFINRFAGKILARDSVRAARLVCNGQVMLLDRCLPWANVVSEEFPGVQLVAYPVGAEEGMQWQVRCAVEPDMKPRIQLPQAWAGLEQEALAAQSAVTDAVFCHRSRHLAGAKSQEGALRLAEAALAAQQLESGSSYALAA